MSAIIADIVVRTALESTLAVTQALLLNRLGLPFAGITVFSGLAAYAVAVTLKYGTFAILPVTALGLVVVLLFVMLAPRLPKDRCLLLSLAALAVARSFAGMLPSLGGQLGISTATTVLPPQDGTRFVPLAISVFLVAVAGAIALQRTVLGLAVDIARLDGSDLLAPALVPIGRIRATLFFFAAIMGSAAGFLLSCYAGRVDPDVFRMDAAITVLVVSLAAGRNTWRVALVPLLFFVFPDLFASLSGYQRPALAHVREIIWGVAIVLLAHRGLETPTGEKNSLRLPEAVSRAVSQSG